jgi:serpin B
MDFGAFLQRILHCGLSVTLASVLLAPAGGSAHGTGGEQAAPTAAALGIDLYHSLAAKGGNVVFSPYSISEVIALLSEGANGETKEELLRALHWDDQAGRLSRAFQAQDLQLRHLSGQGVTLLVANGLWYQDGNPPRQAFLQTARDEFGAEVRGVDFVGNASAARREINGWIEQKTLGKISGLVPEGALNASTRLALANAVYFKGQWTHPFEAARTAPRPFFIAPGTSVMVPQMTERDRFRVSSNPTCDLLELPYHGGDLAMVILLPRARGGLSELEQSLNPSVLLQWLAALDLAKLASIHVTLPRFKMTYAVELTEALRQLGVTAAFDAHAADFSAIDGRRDLHVSTVLHKAFVDVNEEGTEAAAATFGGMSTLAVERSDEFRVDRPFIFVIRDHANGSLLFLGRVADPRAM